MAPYGPKMKTKRISTLDLVSVIGAANIRSAVIESKSCTYNQNEYVLLVNASISPSTGNSSGIISFFKNGYDAACIGMYCVYTSSVGYKSYSNNTDLKIFSVVKAGIKYLAIKKPLIAYQHVRHISMSGNNNVFEVVNAADLTEITPIV